MIETAGYKAPYANMQAIRDAGNYVAETHENLIAHALRSGIPVTCFYLFGEHTEYHFWDVDDSRVRSCLNALLLD